MKAIFRIKHSQDFALAIKKGKALHNSSFTVHFKDNGLNYCRVGISASNKLGNAVLRNRIRRQIRAMCHDLIDFENTKLDIVIIARKDFLNKSYEENRLLLGNIINSQVGNKE